MCAVEKLWTSPSCSLMDWHATPTTKRETSRHAPHEIKIGADGLTVGNVALELIVVLAEGMRRTFVFALVLRALDKYDQGKSWYVYFGIIPPTVFRAIAARII
jgi:hypothetical protein